MVILHLLVLIDIGNLIVRAEFDQLASCPIASSHVHTAVVENRRWNDCDSPWKGRLPQDRAVLRRNTDHVLRCELNVFSRSVVLGDDNGSVVRRVGKFLRLPDEFARHFIERGDRALATARSANDPIAVHEHGLTVAPTGRLAAEVLHRFLPNHLAIGRARTNQIALAAQGVNPIAIHSGCSARTAAPIELFDRTDGRRPQLVTRPGVQRQQDFGAVAGAHRE